MSMDVEWTHRLMNGAQEMGIELPEHRAELLARYCELLYAWNEKLNLTRVPACDALERHILDSLALAVAVKIDAGWRGLDLGTGAGLPGIALCVAFAFESFVLMDGTAKKLRFVDIAIAELGLANASTLHARAEDAARGDSLAGAFDLVVARAVARMDRLASWMLPLVRPGGLAVAYKTAGVADELRLAETAIRKHQGIIVEVVTVRLPVTGVERCLVVMRKRSVGTRGRRRHA